MRPTGAPRLAAILLAAVAPGAAAQAAPADSVLAAACAGGGSTGDGLLLVVFRPDLTPAARATIAGEVGAALAGPAPVGGDYLRFPPEARVPLDVAADRLIRRDGIQEVGGVSCPPAPPPPAADTAAADSAAPRPPTAPADSAPSADTTRTR